jgi:dienelactone hydrolase
MVMWRFRWCGWGTACAVLALATAGCSSTGPSSTAVRLDAGPATATAVTSFHVSVSGLPPSGLVTMQARTADDQGRPWQSAATFRAGSRGTLNLTSAAPVSGSYHTADVGGLLWSLHPAFSTGPDTGFVASRTGFTVQLTVLTGGHVRARATLKRLLPATSSTPTVAKDGFTATFYPPVSARPGAPAIVVIGGYPDDEAIPVAQGLAMSGYPALAVGYFNEPGLAKCQCSTPLEYFARAVSWLRAQPAARGRQIVLYGGSDGTQAALLLAAYEPHLTDAVVLSSPTDIIHGAFGGSGPGWTYGGKALPAGTLIPVSKIRVPVLMGDGGQDAVWDSAGSAAAITSEIERTAGHAAVTNLYYPDAGHYYFGKFPYFPFFTNAGLGGTQPANAQATEQFWTHMITFLDQIPAHQT